MSKAHRNSILPIINSPIACDANTSFMLSPLSVEMYSDSGLIPTSNISVFRKDEGKFNNAVYISTGGKLIYDSTNIIDPLNGTVSFWYSPSYDPATITTQPLSPTLIQIGDYYNNSSITIWNFINGFSIHVKGVSGTGWCTSTYSNWNELLVQDSYVFCTVSWDNLIWKTYLNGILISNTTASVLLGPISGDVINIGCNSEGTTSNGLLSEIRIDKSTKTDDEVLQMYLSNTTNYLPNDFASFS